MVDYSKWDNIEVSDDEDETHPNIDKGSLFRWRHQARVEKMEELEKKKKQLDDVKKEHKDKIVKVRNQLETLQIEGKNEDAQNLAISLKDLQKQDTHFRQKEKELRDEEKNQPWNVDTLSKPGFEKTVINATDTNEKEKLPPEEVHERSKVFMEKYRKEMKEFGMLQDYHASEEFLVKYPFLTCEDTANYLVIWCIDLEVEEKHALMERVAHQTICMQFLLELAKSLKIDPRATIRPFFSKMRKQEAEYMEGFMDELNSFVDRVKGRAQATIEKAMKEYEEEEKKKRLGPGGLDPVEVFETLPTSLQECFESKNIAMLQDVLSTMPDSEARYHLTRCIDSGLWLPDAKAAGLKKTANGEPVEQTDETTEFEGSGEYEHIELTESAK